MKVALLSFHTAYNFGACLQAYALQEAIAQQGIDCEYINYVNPTRREQYDMFAQIKSEMKKHNYVRVAKLICGIPFMACRKQGFEKFYNNNLRKTTTTYRSSAEAKALNTIYDKFVVGSDQVWNPENNGSDTAFLLDFVEDNSKRISYSSSFGLSEIPENLIDSYAENIRKFNRLAVREIAGINIIKKLCNRNSHLVLDPVFLLEREKWEKMAKHPKTKKEYIFFYTNQGTQIERFFATGYPRKESHILSSHVSPMDFLSRSRKVKFSMSPESFLGEIMDAKLVVTASFHCLAFAIIFRKPFIAILTGDKGKDERILNLLRITGLEDRVLDRKTTQSIIEKAIDYELIENKLKDYRTNSLDYLVRAIKDCDDIDYTYNRIPDEREDTRFCNGDACTGCGACVSACPTKALHMRADEEGFLRPEVDEKMCVHCGLCHRKCQVYSLREKIPFGQKYYGVKNNDENRRESSSGGVFKAVAEQIINMGGVVCAAQMDKDFRVSHSFAFNLKDIINMQRTYYVQSITWPVLKQIEAYLKEGKYVLFVGTPCQVEGVRLFIGKEYENLITVDIVCHGVPSPLVFSTFIDYLKGKGSLQDYRFRDKELGWEGYTVSAVIDGKKIANSLWLESFNKMFTHNLINRPSCSMCQYTNYNRPGDITIGDFWGIDKIDSNYKDDLGISLVIVNSDKGQRVFDKLNISECREYKQKDTQQNSLKHPATANPKRSYVFQCIQTEGYEAAAKKYGEYNIKGLAKDLLRKIINS